MADANSPNQTCPMQTGPMQRWQVTRLCEPATPELVNEDAAVIRPGKTGQPHIGVVVDGAGLPKALRAGCHHSVAWYSTALADAFASSLTDHDRTMPEALAAALDHVRALHADECDLSQGSPSATTAAFRVAEGGARIEWLVLCDASVVIVNEQSGVVEHCDDRLATTMRAATNAVLAENGLDRQSALSDHLLDARIRATQLTRNREGGWWCCQDDPGAAAQALTGSVGVEGLVRVALCSDGATRGHQLFDAWTLAQFGDRLADPARLLVDTRAVEHERAAWLQERLLKLHDDLSVVLLSRG